MKKFLSLFDPRDGVEISLNLLLCVPFGFLIAPPLVSCQLGLRMFVLASISGWLLLPWLSWTITKSAWKRSGRQTRQGQLSLFLWVGLAMGWIPIFCVVDQQFWLQNDRYWGSAIILAILFLLGLVRHIWRQYAKPVQPEEA